MYVWTFLDGLVFKHFYVEMTSSTWQSTEAKTHEVLSMLLTKEAIWPWELISGHDQKFFSEKSFDFMLLPTWTIKRPTKKWLYCCTIKPCSMLSLLGWCLSNSNVDTNHLGILLKYRFWYSMSGWSLRFFISNKLPLGGMQTLFQGHT